MPGARLEKMPKWMYKNLPTVCVKKLYPKLGFVIPKDPIKLKGPDKVKRKTQAAQMRLIEIGKTMTDLFRDERIETHYWRAYEVSQYAEMLIVEAMRNGDRHVPTMEMASFYLHEKQLVHKLFKVLVPRYLSYTQSFTQMHLLPINTKACLLPDGGPAKQLQWALLELKGNPLPPVTNDRIDSTNFLTNILLKAAQHDN